MKNLYEMLDQDGESLGIVATDMNEDCVTLNWKEYCKKEREDFGVDEFCEIMRLSGWKIKRLFTNPIQCL